MSEVGQWLRVHPDGPQPLFEQLRSQLIAGIRQGRLDAGARLPTVRELAVELALAANTVARAYRELEAAGIIETRGRRGTFVAHVDPADAAMAAAARAYADTVAALGLRRADAIRYVEAAIPD